jgi:hypothetical protein
MGVLLWHSTALRSAHVDSFYTMDCHLSAGHASAVTGTAWQAWKPLAHGMGVYHELVCIMHAEI